MYENASEFVRRAASHDTLRLLTRYTSVTYDVDDDLNEDDELLTQY
jgi:hypothetical protein